MGLSESKLKSPEEINTPEKKQTIVTDLSEFDPRSPTINVARTPIQLFNAIPNSKDDNTHKTASFDPRSPTIDFNRTPIMLSNDKIPAKLHNKLLENVIKSSMFVTPKRSNITPEKLSLTPPKLIETTSTISTLKKEKRKSFVGILETNVDYTETNLDEYVKNNALDSALSIKVIEHSENGVNLIDCESDPRSPTTDFLRTPIQMIKKTDEFDIVETKSEEFIEEPIENTVESLNLLKIADESIHDEISKPVTSSDNLAEIVSVKDCAVQADIEQNNQNETDNLNVDILCNKTEILPNDSVTKIETNLKTVDDKIKQLFEETSKFIPINDKTPIYNSSTDTHDFDGENSAIKPDVDLSTNVKNFDKKLSEIIYGVDRLDSIKAEQSAKVKVRTPLKDQNMILDNKRSKLRVSDKPRKIDYQTSKIPVFKEKKVSKRANLRKQQCENTPPTAIGNYGKSVNKDKSLWDCDKTVII